MNNYDLVINGGKVIDVESKADDVINIGIERGVIKLLSQEKLKGKKEINASRLIITPGFIDIHTHEDSIETAGFNGQGYSLPIETSKVFLKTGVTTMIGGNCGFSAYPIGPYLDKITKNKISINYGTLLGYNSLREIIGIDRYEGATKNQIEKLKNMAEKEIASGALGVSFGLEYSPGITTVEVVEISKIVKKFSKYIAVHMRYSSPKKALENVREMVEVARETGVRVEISHLAANVYGKDEGKNVLEEALLLIHEAVDEDLDILADVYPYDTWGVPSIKTSVFDEGWINNYNFSYKDIEILTGTHAGERCTPKLFDSLRAEDRDTMVACHNAIPLDDIRRAIQDPLVCIMSDGQMTKDPLTGDLKGHPRSAGTPAKLIGDIIREKKWISLEEGISKLTLIPAKRLKLSNKGRLQEGKDADITVFNLEKIIDKSKFGKNICASSPEGIEYVIINGDIAYEKKIIKNNNLGRCI